MRVLSYNIFEGGGAQGERAERIVGIVEGVGADVVALLECNGFHKHGSRRLYSWERQLGMRGFLLEARTGFHIALFVKDATVLEVHRQLDWFHHGALWARLRFGDKELTVIATHLSPFSGESRVREVQYLATHLRSENVVLMGDLNALSRHDAPHLDLSGVLPYRRARHYVAGSEDLDTRAMDFLESAGMVDLWHTVHPGQHAPTLPTPLTEGVAEPILRLDYIWGSRAVAERVRDCTVIVSDGTRGASDHYPVLADIDL